MRASEQVHCVVKMFECEKMEVKLKKEFIATLMNQHLRESFKIPAAATVLKKRKTKNSTTKTSCCLFECKSGGE